MVREKPGNLNIVNSFPEPQVADIWACDWQWKAKGAHFPTEPLDNHGHEMRCYTGDLEGYFIEGGQFSQEAIKDFKKYNG